MSAAAAYRLSEHLTAFIAEYLASLDTVTLGGVQYQVLAGDGCLAGAGEPAEESVVLRAADGTLFEAWVQAGATPALKAAEVTP